MVKKTRQSKQSRIKKTWLLYLTMGLLLVLLVLVGMLVWKIVSSDTSEPMVMDEPLTKPLSKVVPLQAVPHKLVTKPVTKHALLETSQDSKLAKHQPAEVSRLPVIHSHPSYVVPAKSGLSFIMDDMGNDVVALRRLLALSIPVTVSILPNATYAVKVAKLTHQAGQMVMLHLPMEPMGEHYRNRMDDSFLRVGMDEATVRKMMLGDLKKIPYVQGINNHMGSRLTSMIEPMTWVMQVCREKSLFFVDSKTASTSLAATVAKQYGLTWGSRAVFLDDSVEPVAMQKAWHQLEVCVQSERRCIVIAHPHRQTLAFLEHKLSILKNWPVRPLRALLHTPK